MIIIEQFIFEFESESEFEFEFPGYGFIQAIYIIFNHIYSLN